MTAIDIWISEVSDYRRSAFAQPIVGQVAKCVAAWQQVLSGLTGGTVTSVGLALPATEFAVTGSPVTTTGTLTAAWQTQAANLVFAGPGSAGPSTPGFRALTASDIPGLGGIYLPRAGGTMTGAITLADGSAAAPELAFGNGGFFNDTTNTGVGIASAGTQIAWYTNASFNVQHSGGSASINLQGDAAANLIVTRYSTDPNGGQISARKARGNIAAPTVVTTNDIVVQHVYSGFDGAAFQTAGSIRATIIDTTPGPTAMGGRLQFFTSPIGSTTSAEIMRLDSAAGLSMFGANPAIDANRLMRNRVFTVATLPTAVEGGNASVSDATLTMITGLGLAPVGAGANHVPVVADNVGWKII